MSSAVEQGLFTMIEILAIGFGLHLLWELGFPRIVRFIKYLYFRARESKEETSLRSIIT